MPLLVSELQQVLLQETEQLCSCMYLWLGFGTRGHTHTDTHTPLQEAAWLLLTSMDRSSPFLFVNTRCLHGCQQTQALVHTTQASSPCQLCANHTPVCINTTGSLSKHSDYMVFTGPSLSTITRLCSGGAPLITISSKINLQQTPKQGHAGTSSS